MKAKVYVTLKKGVLDPQGKAVMSALQSTGFDEVTDVRIGKFMELEIKDGQKDAEEARLKQMCEKLLANTVIENYRIELE
ncbi:MAG: phosphoribosylformylglycinamidine synthase subunit PurS [Deltaproteobacteria bacterium]